ncbi:MAG: hypothetical protein H6Q65_401 [Firmicutes bacterium]|nr:hypothetical protein [Bacillota bacterium]
MPEILLNNQRFSYQIRRIPRKKTITLKLLTATELEICAPARIKTTELHELLQKNQNWILKKSAQRNAIDENPVNASLASGTQLLFQGRLHLLQIMEKDTKRPEIFLTPNKLSLCLPSHKIEHAYTLAQEVLRKWYIENASRQFTEKTTFWAGRLNVRPVKISIRDQKSRWGSCSSRGNINYNWRIVMAPPEIMDYLVVHELCHMRVANHSSLFWELVAQFIPEYKQHRNWLKENGNLLTRLF